MVKRTEREMLQRLIEICRDGERGFLAAAEHVSQPELQTLFRQLAVQRKRFADELVPHLQRMGASPDDGSNAATLHRGWIHLKGAMLGSPDHAIVTEAERGEHVALDAYQDALNGLLPPTVSELVETQRDAIEEATERIRTVDMRYA